MDYLTPKPKQLNPEHKTNIVLGLFFTYSKDILVRGFKKELTEDDIYEVLPSYQAKKLGDNLETEWKKLVSSQKISVLRLLWRCFGKQCIIIICSLIIPVVTGALQPTILKQFISYFTSKQSSKTDAWIYGFALILILFVDTLYSQNYFLRIHTFILKMRIGLTTLIYRKILEMNSSDVNNRSVGKIVTLITKDVNELQHLFVLTTVVKDFIVYVMLCYILYAEIGWLFLILVLITLTILLPDSCLAVWIKQIKLKTLKKTEERYQQTKEVLTSIKLIKSYGWGEKYEKTICELRRKEVGLIAKIQFWSYVKFIFADYIFDLSWYCLLVSCIFFEVKLNAGSLFLIMNTLNLLYKTVKLNVPVLFHKMVIMITVLTRIEEFLKTVNISTSTKVKSLDLPPKVAFSSLVVCASDRVLVENLNFEASVGVTVITGPTASGKSTLLKVITKEHVLVEGSLTVHGTVSYASQEPWLFPSTIKQNILFGAEYNAKRYQEVLRVCALCRDLEALKQGDNTLLLDRGVNLSKGQQVRINLARAVYKNCDIYLLDDCLSSLDVLVATFIFQECIQKFLEGKIVIMVSQYIGPLTSTTVITLGVNTTEFSFETVTQHKEVLNCKKFQKVESEIDETQSLISKAQETELYAERKRIGRVEFTSYKKYVTAGGVVLLILPFLITIPIEFLRSALRKQQSQWINAEQTIFNNLTDSLKYQEALHKRHQMLYLLPILVITAGVASLVSIKIYFTFTARASIHLHKVLFGKIINATMTFFDSHLIGTVLNRFSEDLLYIDETISICILVNLTFFFRTIGNVVVVATVKRIFLIPCTISILLLIFARKFYLRSGRALKRLEFASRSPLLGVINATLDGLSTIRTSNQQNILRKEFDRRLDLYTSCSYIFQTSAETFYFFVELCGLCLLCFVVVLFIVLDKGVSTGDIGLVLIQTITFISLQHFVFRGFADLENDMTTVERTLEYTKQEQEKKNGNLLENWPTNNNNQIKYKNICFSYKNGVQVLKNLNFCVKSQEKVAVVGRTGSGKTSLMYSLLRLYKFSGTITIDGVDITTLPLDFYRSKIAVIPQEPMLFKCSLRDNIDPTGKYSDEEIWTAIRSVKLSTVFESLDNNIDVDSNLSLGQKQLICLCRTLIRRNKIVIMDEVTANVDDETEEMIHEIIDELFAESTVMMITHKLRFIMRYDKVLVLDEGRVAEFGSPSFLLQNENGTFYKMYNFSSGM